VSRRPEPTATSAPFWQAVAHGQLSYPRCPSCFRWHSYPRPWCTGCLHEPLRLHPVSGFGTVHAVTVVHRALSPAFTAQVPYAHALVDLDEGLRVLSLVVGCPPDDVHQGMRVRAALGDDALVLFRPSQV